MSEAIKRLLVVLMLVIVMAVPSTQVMAKETKTVYSKMSGIPVKKQGDWWYYILTKDSGAVVCGYEGKSVNVKIPKKLGGKKVTVIERFAQNLEKNGEGHKKVKSIVIPDTVTHIKGYAFGDCKALETIKLSKNLDTIESAAFADCINLKSIKIPEGITSIDESTFSNCKSLESVSLPKTLKSISERAFHQNISLETIEIPQGVTAIGESAFIQCKKLNSISIPNGVQKLESSTFSGCRNLSEIDIPASVTQIEDDVFTNTKWLYNKRKEGSCVIVNNILLDGVAAEGKVVIPKGVKVINLNAFFDNTKIIEVVIPESVTEIGDNAFLNCVNLEKVELPNILNIGESAFENTKWYQNQIVNDSFVIVNDTLCEYKANSDTVTIPDGVKAIGTAAFSNSQLKEIIIPESVTNIGTDAFADCRKLESVIIQGNLTCIEARAFTDCCKLKSVNIHGSVKNIGDFAFSNCRKLEEINFSEGLESIGIHAFNYSGLKSFKMPKSVKTIGCESFHNTPWHKSKQKSKSFTIANDILLFGGNVKGKVKIPKGVRVICGGAFSYNQNITQVEIPASVKEIGNNAFYYCKKLTSVKFKKGLKSIAACAFRSTGLKEITIPASVEKIEECAFGHCKKLKKVVFYSKNCKMIGELSNFRVFYNSPKTEIHGYKGSTAQKYAISNNLKFKKMKK